MASNRKWLSRMKPVAGHGFWPRSLHGRLVLLPSALLLLGLLGTICVIFLHARSRIGAEVTSSVQLAHDLGVTALRNVAGADSKSSALTALARDLPQVRHVEFGVAASGGTVRSAIEPSTEGGVTRHVSVLATLLAPPQVVQSFPIVVRGDTVGRLIIQSNPADELNEIVGEVELFSLVLVGLCLATMGSLLLTVRRSLRPLQLLTEGFDRLEHGDYRPIADIPVAELARVGCQFNLLAASLRRMTSDNRLLIDRLLSMQDCERKEVAAELHDEIGPVLFAIRAEAACLLKAVPRSSDSFARAQSIASLTDGIQRVNYRMLERLRPLVLEQMGLSRALRQLLSSWQTHCPHIMWSLDVQADFDSPDEVVELTLYLAAQEAITNAVRHAQASEIRIQLAREGADGIMLAIRDDGLGLPESFRYGFGLLGMTERVRQVRGLLSVSNAGPGVLVAIIVPARKQQTVEMVHADSAD
jgi:two-component system, NarL family, sensor histidine kinase UhpB